MVDPAPTQTPTDIEDSDALGGDWFATRSERSPISLAFLFYLVTLGGILSACLSTLAGDESAAKGPLALGVFIGAIFGVVTMFVIGLVHFRSLRAAFLGAGCGMLVGAIAGALARIDPSHFLQINLMTGVGVWMMIVVMCLTARYRLGQAPAANAPRRPSYL